MKQQLERDSTTDYIGVTVWDHNQRVVPTAATVSIYDGANALVSAATATIAADGAVTYIPGTTVTEDAEENLKAEWTLTIDSAARKVVQLFDVVNFKLFPMVSDEDLISECAQLQTEGYRAYGTADSGTTTTLVDIELMEYRDNHWEGGTLEILGGTNSGTKRVVASSVKATGTVTVSSAFSSAIDSTSKFMLRRTYQREIDRAWDDLMERIISKGNRPALIMNSESLKPTHIMWALEKICRDLSTTQDDIWWARSEYYSQRAAAWWNQLVFLYDSDEDEQVDTRKRMTLQLRR